jgi:hypothetical protein
MNDLIAGRYQVMDFLGAAAFSRAVQALDVKTNTLVCLKIVKVNVMKVFPSRQLLGYCFINAVLSCLHSVCQHG